MGPKVAEPKKEVLTSWNTGEKMWKVRFGVLFEDRLDWWKTEEAFNSGKKEHGRCPLNDGCASGDAQKEAKRSNTFFVERTRSNGKKQRFFFKAQDADDRDDWINQVTDVISGEAKSESEEEEDEDEDEEDYESCAYLPSTSLAASCY